MSVEMGHISRDRVVGEVLDLGIRAGIALLQERFKKKPSAEPHNVTVFQESTGRLNALNDAGDFGPIPSEFKI